MEIPSYDVLEEIGRHGPYVVCRGRRQSDQLPVLLEAPAAVAPDASESEALERQFELLHASSIAGLPRVHAVARTDRSCLILEDRGLRPLGSLPKPLDLPVWFAIATRLCTILDGIHRRRIVHGSVSPSSVLVNRDGSDVQLLNVGLVPGFWTDEGTGAPGLVAYVSPEQTGRVNRPVDYRTDFYSLGVTFYEVLIGVPPFTSEDSLELVHAHIAKAPTDPILARPEVPEQLSRIIVKLLAKAPDDRYQSALGLKHDLERCRSAWMAEQTIPLFDLATHDGPDRFLIPDRLYGRERELGDLLSAFNGTRDGLTTFMLVSGYSGIGKTSLIREFQKAVVRQRGYFIAGKFDQVVRSIPYGAFTQALRGLVWQLLTESEDRLQHWRTRLSAALGTNGGVLAEVIPEIELIVGKQPLPPPLDPTEARNRFAYVFQRFVGEIADQEHPLVVFLDDLQWVDAATLDLLHALLTGPEIHHLMLIGAYRDNEVDAGHLLTWAVHRLESSGALVSRSWLGPLVLSDLTSFVADTLRRDTPDVTELAGLIQKKTDGNPFFVIQFLQTLEHEGHFLFDHERGGWTFQMDAIAAAGITDNVVDLMTRKIRRLSPHGQACLTLAACIGNQFDRDTFFTVSRQSRDDAAAGLSETLDAGLIQESGRLTALSDSGATGRVLYTFLHDRVQQAAYGLIPETQMTPLHLDVGRLLLADFNPEGSDDRIFTIINHLNIGSSLVAGPDERLSLARLNLTAGRKAKTSAAYRAAVEYFEKGLALLAPSHWRSDHALMFSLHIEAAECQYLAGSFDRAEAAFEQLLQHAATPLEQAHVHSLRITLYENQSRWTDAMSAARDGLALFGIEFPETAHDKDAALDREIETVQRLLGTRGIASLIELPEMTDPGSRMVMRILTIAWAPAYISGDQILARLISAAMVRLSLTHGNTEDSAYGYVTHAITVGPIRRDYRSAYEWGVLALSVNARFDDVKRRAKIHQQFQAHVNLWSRPFETCIAHARVASQSGLETGDFPYAGYGAATEAWSAWVINRDIDRFVRHFSPTLGLLEKVNMLDFRAAHRVILNWARALQGRTASRVSLSDGTFDESRFIAQYQHSAPFFLTFVYTARLHLCFMFGQYAEALVAARHAEEVAVRGTLWPVLIDFWGALAAAADFDTVSEEERGHRRHRLLRVRETLDELAAACPENFRCFALLVAAEVERINSHTQAAAHLCEEALAYARQTSNLQQEALANELCARIWLSQDDGRGRRFLNDAYRCYADWGALAKVAQLEERYGPLLALSRPRTPTPLAQNVRAHAAVHADIATALKVATAIAVEIEVGALLRQLMKLALENAGAQRGVFLQVREGALEIEAEAVADSQEVRVGPIAPLDQVQNLPRTVVRYVRRTGQDVVLGNPAADERFAIDEYIVRTQPKSILCVPVGHQGRLGGILYLENNLTTEAFSPDRIEMMRILAAQTAIALENARLYENMKCEVEKRTAAEHALRGALSEVEALKNRLEAENVYLQEEIRTQHNFNEIVGNSPPLLDALRKVERVAPTESTVLIIGETGSGKELFARAVHNRSKRGDRPLVKVNCGAIAPGLVESELFGHVKGAFTGAIEKRVGRFELANGGTIFLDEIGELPLDAQVKLLRVLQEQEFEPVGSSRTVQVSVRVIAATNRNLDQAVLDGRFRADLLYRLNVFPIQVPPLRERPSDIGLLVAFFATSLTRKLGKPIHGFSTRSIEQMRGYSWPGNVRELQNVVERAAILAAGPVLELEGALFGATPVPVVTPQRHGGAIPARPESLDDVQRLRILEALQGTGGVVEGARGAATVLGLHPNTLRSRMKKLGIANPRRDAS